MMRYRILFLILVSLAVSSIQADERPNILWLSVEDISPHLGCYGYPNANTPVLDTLATEGTRYTHAYTCAGVCAPSRSTIITGMYQTTIGTQHMRAKAELPDHIKPFTIPLRESGYYCTNNAKTDYQFNEPENTWDESSGKAHWKNRPGGKPFFAVFNYTGCHESGIANTEKYKTVTEGLTPIDRDLAAQSLPPYYPDTPAVREDWGRYYDVITAMDRWVGEHLKALDDAGLADNTIVIYWSDHGVGLPRAKRWLYESGTHVPLIVRIPEKFRTASQGKPGTVSDQLISLMDLGPTTLNLAGVATPTYMQGQPFLGAALPAPRDYIFGARDRMDERYDIIRMVRDKQYRYIRNYEPFKPYYQYMNTPEKGVTMMEIRKAEKNGTANPVLALNFEPGKPKEELYDVATDPHEIHNLAADPAHKETLDRLRQVHLDWVLETRDVGLIPEPDIAVREKALGSAWALLNGDDGATLMGRLREAASLALGGPDKLADMVAALSDDDGAIRYWAATALGNLGSEGQSAMDALKTCLNDDSVVVRVAAARGLARMGAVDDAIPVLEDVLDNGAQWERLHAAIALDELDEAARPALACMERNKAYRKDMVQKGKYTVRVLNRALNELQGTEHVVD